MFRIYLEARNSFLNQKRFYSMGLSQDLLGDWILQIIYGRIGNRGHKRLCVFNTPEQALPKIKALLRTRASAPHRSGCTYKIIEIYQEREFASLNIETLLQPGTSKQKTSHQEHLFKREKALRTSQPTLLSNFQQDTAGTLI